MENNIGLNNDAERVRELTKDPETARELRRIIDGVCHQHQINHMVLVSPIRTKSVVSARYSAYWLIRERLNISYALIGALLDRDHRSVMNGIAKTNAARTQAILEGWSHPVDSIQKFIGPVMQHTEEIHDNRI
jgi:chromosomal replication initiation ATPase DnaA